jgi:perosamine synthetase
MEISMNSPQAGSRIPVAGPWITEKEVAYVTDAARHGWYDRANEYIDRFESAFANYVGRRFAISLPSCTSGLHLSLLALGIGPGDEVIVPDITWIATAAPINYVGATPVFADIDPKTWCMSAETIKAKVTPRTKAIIVVDLYGNMPDMNPILSLAKERNLAIIEDAAEAIGSRYEGKMAGAFGVFSAFSFHGTKTLTTGEGGMLLTDERHFYDRCLMLRDHGRQPADKSFRSTEVAYKYKMSGLQAALGLAQIERVEELVSRKREIFGWYKEELQSISGCRLNHEAPSTRNTYWMVTIILAKAFGMEKGRLIDLLKENKIDCRPFFDPLSSIPAYQSLPESQQAKKQNHVAYEISLYGINLPSGFNVSREIVQYVCNTLKGLLSPAKG